MFGRASLLATVLLAPVITAAPAVSALTGTCNAVSVAPCVTKLRAYTSGSAFCTTWLSISTQTATASTTSVTTSIATDTSTSTTGTTTIPAAETVTVLDHGVSVIGHAVSETVIAHATTEWAPTPTVVAHVSFTTITTTLTSTICGNAKRAAATNIPSVLQSFKSSIISSACSCLPLTTPSTTVTTTASSTALTTTTETQNVLATETTTSTVTSTWYTTSIPTLTTIVTPTTTLTPAPVTSTPVSTATVTETKTVHVGQAAVQLTNPTPIITAASRSYDDDTGLRINNIPFDVGLYGVTSRTLIIGINGWVSPGTTDSGTYVNQPLPNRAAGDPSWVAYWADLYVTQGTTQGIYYQIDGDEGSRTLSIEYFMSFFGASSAYTHFMVTLFEEEVGRVVFSYFQTTSTKASTNSAYGTIGVQRPATGQYNQYSYNVQPQEGLTIEWRPSTNQWTQVSSGTC